MKIWVQRLSEAGTVFEGEEPSERLELENDPFVRPSGPVRYRLRARRISGELLVRGSLSAEFDLQCSRCAEFYSTTVGDSDFLRAYSITEETDFVEIGADLREALLLRLPSFPVCRENCPGLCPKCGAPLEAGACGCERDDAPGSWSALDGLDLS